MLCFYIKLMYCKYIPFPKMQPFFPTVRRFWCFGFFLYCCAISCITEQARLRFSTILFSPIQPSQITSLCKLHPGETATSGPLTAWLNVGTEPWKPDCIFFFFFFLAAGASHMLPGAEGWLIPFVWVDGGCWTCMTDAVMATMSIVRSAERLLWSCFLRLTAAWAHTGSALPWFECATDNMSLYFPTHSPPVVFFFFFNAPWEKIQIF